MDARLLLELLDNNDNGRKWYALLKRCLNASEPVLDEFIDNLSRSFDTRLPTLQNFISYLYNKYLQVTQNDNLRWYTLLARFISSLITVVIMKNLHNSDLLGFDEFLHNCIEIFWWANNNQSNNNSNSAFQTIRLIFSSIMDADGVLEVLVSQVYGHRCFKRILFDFNMINRIKQIELLKAIDVIVALIEKCTEHKNVLSFSEGFSVYNACTALLETLSNQDVEQILPDNKNDFLPPMLNNMANIDDKEQHWNRAQVVSTFRNNLTLSIKDEQHLALLGMVAPQRPSDLPHFLLALEQRKIDCFWDLMGFLPCTSCHKHALNYIYPNKYFLEEELPTSECLRLPFEFNDDDKLGPWDILLSEETIKDLQQLESIPEVVRVIMKKLGHISSGEWDKHKLRCTVRSNIIPVYEVALPDNDLKILWQVDYGFSIRSSSLMQHVKIWAITANKEQIDKILENLSIVHNSKQSHWCVVRQMGKNNIILPMILEDDDILGPWIISLSEDATEDLQLLESTPEVIGIVMKKLGHISSGEWDKHKLQCIVRTNTISVYEVLLPDTNGLKILWQVDYGFSICSNSLTQIVKIWAVTANEERINKLLEKIVNVNKKQFDKISENLSIVHTFKQSHWRVVRQVGKNNIILPMIFGDDNVFGPWNISLSEDTIKNLQRLESTPEVIRVVMKKLGHISSAGEWDKHKLQYTVRTNTIPAALPDNNLEIHWQVDYRFSNSSNSLAQLINIWAVTGQIDKKQSHWRVVGQIGKNNNIILPIIPGNEVETKSTEHRLYSSKTDDELLGIHKMIVTNKFIPLSSNLYKSLVLGGLNFTFQVSKKEYEIINCPTSAIIIGRSGTGKTTCIVFRQIASYLNNQRNKTSTNGKYFNKRQIFITMSKELRHRVKKYFNKLKYSAALAGTKMTMAQFRKEGKKKEEDFDQIMHEEKDDEQELKNIPDSFNHLHLTDKYFPLFITFDKFTQMLQGTYGINNQEITKQKKYNADNIDLYDNEKDGKPSSGDTEDENFVDYKKFLKKYWTSLDNYCNQKFDCELVYSEFSIIKVICTIILYKSLSSSNPIYIIFIFKTFKGSNPEGDFLSREDYRTVSTKKYPVFCYNRDQIYDLFLQYEKMKARRGHYDSIDRTLAISRCAKKKALGGLHIHEVYIDECQDNHIVDIALILKVFETANSIFLAGDIAQCIARGSSFRFQDLRALMYQWELTRAQANHRSIIKPKQFDLNINYRTHNGILQLAASVVDLIRHFFPNSIDKLLPECSEVGGPQPIIFDGFQKSHFNSFVDRKHEPTYTYGICMETKCRKRTIQSSFIEFGADQVIIVRDKEAKEHLEELIGKAGLVMTVFETKGMEFNDVLLYNFFTDSPACRKWRVILSILSENPEGVPDFSHEKHYILSSELKHLYVAVTRARQHIWICDENTEYSMPIRKYWEHLELIKVSHEISFSKLAKKSDSHEWNKQGREFFEQRRYEQVKSVLKYSVLLLTK
ncbi:hypothetical protein C1645_318131 [Glomus cerebriforme]|uniref:Uncharacterized protein n=1 Tax=Glomus cerebriforme TaxID=658196 RepID=A0A397SRX1_9GLOM|nr:hypothetical protein C1645_318131 [Glomus cerebriforme]